MAEVPRGRFTWWLAPSRKRLAFASVSDAPGMCLRLRCIEHIVVWDGNFELYFIEPSSY
jgi:hypothetical protein